MLAAVELFYHVMNSPLGLLFLAGSEKGLCAVHYMDRRSLKRTLAQQEARFPGAHWTPSLMSMKGAVDQLGGYFLGTRREFELPLDLRGTEFHLQVWNELLRIPYGETRTYGQIAAAVGQPRATRAVGLANHDNPCAIVVPCHRVVGAQGRLTGYGGGLPRKKWLLRHELQNRVAEEKAGELALRYEGRTARR